MEHQTRKRKNGARVWRHQPGEGRKCVNVSTCHSHRIKLCHPSIEGRRKREIFLAPWWRAGRRSSLPFSFRDLTTADLVDRCDVCVDKLVTPLSEREGQHAVAWAVVASARDEALPMAVRHAIYVVVFPSGLTQFPTANGTRTHQIHRSQKSSPSPPTSPIPINPISALQRLKGFAPLFFSTFTNVITVIWYAKYPFAWIHSDWPTRRGPCGTPNLEQFSPLHF